MRKGSKAAMNAQRVEGVVVIENKKSHYHHQSFRVMIQFVYGSMTTLQSCLKKVAMDPTGRISCIIAIFEFPASHYVGRKPVVRMWTMHFMEVQSRYIKRKGKQIHLPHTKYIQLLINSNSQTRQTINQVGTSLRLRNGGPLSPLY